MHVSVTLLRMAIECSELTGLKTMEVWRQGQFSTEKANLRKEENLLEKTISRPLAPNCVQRALGHVGHMKW